MPDRTPPPLAQQARSVRWWFQAIRRSPVVGDAAKKIGPYVTQRDFSQTFETVDWSQARYDDYGFIALDVVPARHGDRTTMTLRFINQLGHELDRVVFRRTAGECRPADASDPRS